MAKPDSPPTPLTDMALGRGQRTTMSLFRNPTTGGIERPKPAPEPEPEPKPADEPPPAAAKPDPAQEDLRFYREQSKRASELRHEAEKLGRDLDWLDRFGTKAPF